MKTNDKKSDVIGKNGLSILGAIVLALGVPIVQMLISPVSADFEISEGIKTESPLAKTLEQEQKIFKDHQPSKAMTGARVKLDCQSLGDKVFHTESDRVQISGVNCDREETGIRNETTGYTASLFFPKEESFLTDFIQLKEGQNKIRIASMSGEQLELVINRKSR